MIQAPVPSQVKFLIPELIEEIDPLTEPTVENATAEDVLQDAIADGGVLVNAWDGWPYFRPKIHTGNRALNGTFDNDSQWTKGTDWTIGGGKANRAAGAGATDLTQAGRLVVGVVYEVIFTVSNYVAGTVTPKAGTGAGTARGADGTFTEDITCAGNTSIIFTATAACDLSIDDVFYRPKSLWRIDTELLRRAEKQLDFAMVVTQNLHEVYQVACANVLRFFQNTSDALPAVPLQPDKILFGQLGLPTPFISLDGINDVGTVSDHADLDFGNGHGSFEMIVRMPDVSGDVYFASRYEDANNQFIFAYVGGSLNAAIKVGGVWLQEAAVAWSPVANTDYHLIWTFENKVSNALYINSVSQSLDTDTTTGGDLSIAADLEIGELNGVAYKVKIRLQRQWNRELSASDVLARYNGWTHTPVPVADQGASQTSIVTGTDSDFSGASNWSGAGATVTMNYDSGDAGHASTMRIEAIDGTNDRSKLTLTTVIGQNYRLRFRYKTISQGSSTTHRVFITTGDLDSQTAENASFTTFQEEFTASATSLELRIYPNDGSGDATDEILVDTLTIEPIGCVMEHNHDGINSVFGKWFDRINQHHATLTGVDYWHIPGATDPAFFFQAFSAFNSRYLFTQFNELLEAGQADTRLGWIIYGQMYGFNFATDGYQASKNWPGVRIGETDVGVILAEQKFGERPSWNITLLAQDTAGWESIQDMLQRITGPLYPFYIIWDYSHMSPVIWQVRLDPEIPFTYVTGSDPWVGITFGIKAE